MRKMTLQSFVLILLFLAASGCGQSFEARDEASSAGEPGAVAEEAPREPGGMIDYDLAQPLPEESLIIYTGDIRMIVADTEVVMREIQELTASLGGRVVSSSVYQSGDNAFSGQITIRVPSEAMAVIQEMAVDVRRAERSSEDVTEEYVDLQARLENLEATAARVRSFLDEADTVEEALAVNQELSRLESEIESYKGRIQYLESRAAFSTITVNLTPDALAQPIEVGGWRLTGTARNAVEALLNALQGLARFLVWLGVFVLPLALLVLVPLGLIVRFVLRRLGRRNRRGETPEA
jgi:hypothetical protein